MNAATDVLPGTDAMILAGGQGERLQPLTASRPKPAIPFGGDFRLIDFTLLNCLNSGLQRVSLLTQYKHEQLHSYIREDWGQLWNGQGKEPLMCLPPTSGKRYRGTADAVFQNIPILRSRKPEFVLILSGDHVYGMDYRPLLAQHVQTGADLTIATVEYPLKESSRFGVLEVDDNFRVIGFEEKPASPRPIPSRPTMAFVSMGVYVFTTEVLINALIEQCGHGSATDFGRHIIPSLISSGRTYAYAFRDAEQNSTPYWRDIGTLDSYYEASMDWIHQSTRFGYPATVRPHVVNSHIKHSVVSSGVRVGANAEIEKAVLMPGVHLGDGVKLRRAVIAEGVSLPEGFQAGFDLNHDRQHHIVTDAGIVVVSKTPVATKPVRTFAARHGAGDTLPLTA